MIEKSSSRRAGTPCVRGFLRRVYEARRKGTATVELAVILPVVLILIFGGLEISRAVHVQHTIVEAARAGARVYAVKETTEQEATAIVDTAMSNAHISGYTLTFDPTPKALVDEQMEPVTATISVPFSRVAWMTPWFMKEKSLTANSVMPADIGEYTSSSDDDSDTSSDDASSDDASSDDASSDDASSDDSSSDDGDDDSSSDDSSSDDSSSDDSSSSSSSSSFSSSSSSS